jgi:Ser-tRNA(Ala) deacylase AlaX
VEEIARRVNEVIDAHLPVSYEFVSRNEVPAEVSLERLPDEASDTLRLVRVGDYDVCACIGTHVENTSEIGRFHINSTSWKEGQFRIVFKLV